MTRAFRRLPIVGLLLLVAAAPACLGQTTYKWTDERGVVHYGEKAPANVRATPVDTQPYGVETGDPRPCATIKCQGERAEAERERVEARKAREAAATRASPEPPPVRGLEFEIYLRLKAGMSEGELLQRAGRPDFESVESTRPVVKSFYWYPTTANPFTTIVTLRGGRIAQLERIKKF